LGFDEFYDDFPELFRQYWRRRSPFWWMQRWLSEYDRVFEGMFREMAKAIPKEQVRERRLSDGSVMREWGPFVYGYSMSMGSDGKPVIREFGNVRRSKKRTMFGFERPGLEPKDTREPLVDIIDEPEQVRVVAELPGVEKSEIKTAVSDATLTIKVDAGGRKYKYLREVELPVTVDPDSSEASYKNGVLELKLRKLRPRTRGKEIKIE
jgi:HSP20 family protein